MRIESANIEGIAFYASSETEVFGNELNVTANIEQEGKRGWIDLRQTGEGHLEIFLLRRQMEDLYQKLGAVLYPPEEAHCATCGAEALPEKEPSDAV